MEALGNSGFSAVTGRQCFIPFVMRPMGTNPGSILPDNTNILLGFKILLQTFRLTKLGAAQLNRCHGIIVSFLDLGLLGAIFPAWGFQGNSRRPEKWWKLKALPSLDLTPSRSISPSLLPSELLLERLSPLPVYSPVHSPSFTGDLLTARSRETCHPFPCVTSASL